MIKKFLPVLFTLFFVNALSAQSFNAQAATDKLASVYQLDDSQKAEMLTIQQRKARNLSEIAGLASTDKATYVQKLKAVQYGTDASIKRMLNKEQMEVYYEQVKIKRQKDAELMSKMKAEGKTPQEIQEALAQPY